jgi:hypothetical protein
MSRAEAARHLLLDFDHPEIPLGLVVVEGNGKIVVASGSVVLTRWSERR